ncbi:MAG TPA: hypothetical protein VKA60_16430 [Blastocatellia bacterium]|nr:hypothetical protein [Blastocatellia bacterium]
MTKSKRIPFYTGTGAVPYDKFGGRTTLRNDFLDAILNAEGRGNFAWLIEGLRGFGKSSFGVWCRDEVKSTGRPALVCYIELAEKVHSEIPVSIEQFIHIVYDEMIEELASFSLRAKGKRLAKAARKRGRLKAISVLGSGGEYEPGDPRPIDIKEFFQDLYKVAKSHSDLLAFVFVLDEITSRKGAESLSSDFIAAIRRLNWPDLEAVVGVILLTTPGFVDRVSGSVNPSRHFIKREKLEVFDFVETKEFVERLCLQAGWTFSNDFVDELFMMSGGIPDLVQRIGVDASIACKKRKATPAYHLTAEDVQKAAATGQEVAASIDGLLSFSGFKLPDRGSEYNKKVLSAFYTTFEPSAVRQGLTKSAWNRGVVAVSPGSTAYSEAFDRVWNALADAKLLVREQGTNRYRFIAEAVRQYLGTMYSE